MSEFGKDLTRREMLTSTGVAGVGIAAGLAIGDSASAAGYADKVPMVTLGRTGRKVSKIGFGGSWDIEPSVLAAGVAEGVNYFDTAESYKQGNSERLMGQFVRENLKRKDYYLVSKTHSHHQLEQRLDGCLKRLGLDYVDVFYLHQVDTPEILGSLEIKEAVERIRKSGKAKFIGFSTHAGMVPECMEAGAAAGIYDQVMFRVNFRTLETDVMNRAIDKCAKANMGLIAMKTLADGTNIPAKYDVFTKAGLNKRQAALKAIWADGRIHSIVSEMVNQEHIAQNTAAAKSKLTVTEAAALKQYAAATDHLYCRGCDHLCRSAAGSVVAVADILRFKMYHDHYGKRTRAKELYAELDGAAKSLENADWGAAEQACPHNLPLQRLLVEATRTLA